MGKKTLSNDTRRSYSPKQAERWVHPPTTTTTPEDYFASWRTTPSTSTSTSKPEVLENGTVVVNEGQCFCDGECSPMGVLNITDCRYGAPGFVSLPHFFNGDPVLTDAVRGLNPEEERHSFYLTLEPVIGVFFFLICLISKKFFHKPLFADCRETNNYLK